MVQTLFWHKPEDRMFINIWLSVVNLVHFSIPNKEVEVMTEIIYTYSGISACKLSQFGAMISSRNYITAP